MSALRRVRHVRLGCASEEEAGHVRLLLEDAMRTASFRDEGRLLLVRRLALGRLPREASAQRWSLRCEEVFHSLDAIAVTAEAPHAGEADVVFFRDASAMWTQLALRVVRGLPCVEWFWQTGAAGWSPKLPQAESLRLCFTKLIELGGVVATVELASQLVASVREMQILMAALSPTQISAALPTPGLAAPVRAVLPLPWQRALAAALKAWPPSDPRVVWLATAAALAEQDLLSPATAVTMADELIAMVMLSGEVSAQGLDPTSKAPVAIPHTTSDAPSASEATTAETPITATAGDDAVHSTVTSERDQTMAGPTTEPDGVLTDFGGLFFMVPLMERLGAAEMPRGAGWLAMRLVLRHLVRHGEDALEDVIPVITNDDVASDFKLRWPAARGRTMRWRDGMVQMDESGRLPLRSGGRRSTKAFPAHVHPAALGLALGAHRLCRSLTRLGLRALVRRTARIQISRTHVDVFLRLADVDVRLRRATFDSDPGWVPWLGRVIRFHYTLDS